MRFAVFVFAAGCFDVTPEPSDSFEWTPFSRVNRGDLCLREAAPDVEVVVAPNDCLSSSCTRFFEGSCEATVIGTTITVTSAFSWEEALGDVGCTDDCMPTDVVCTIGEGLPPATYTVTHGEDTLTVKAPLPPECSVGYGG